MSGSLTTSALIALIVGVAASAGGYAYGMRQGAVAESARRDGKAVADLTKLITSHQSLIDQANAASRRMRGALARRAAADTQTTQEFKDALAATADSRAGCVFPADVMRQLAAARERAAQAAAGGIQGALPSAPASASRP